MTRSVLPSDWIYIPLSGLENEMSSTNWRKTARTDGGHINNNKVVQQGRNNAPVFQSTNLLFFNG